MGSGQFVLEQDTCWAELPHGSNTHSCQKHPSIRSGQNISSQDIFTLLPVGNINF